MSADQSHGLDLAALTGYLDREVPGLLVGPLTGRLIAGSRSNLTYLVSDGTATWVVRRPPLGHVLETAHDMGREHRVTAALRDSDVLVPDMVALCRDPEVLGGPFSVMSFVDGTVFRTQQQLAELPSAATRELADGLVDLGRPDGYLERQLRRWGKQLEASRSRELPELAGLYRG